MTSSYLKQYIGLARGIISAWFFKSACRTLEKGRFKEGQIYGQGNLLQEKDVHSTLES